MNNFDPKIQSILTLLNTNEAIHIHLIKELMRGQSYIAEYQLCYDLIYSLLSYYGSSDFVFFDHEVYYVPTENILVHYDDNGRLFAIDQSVWIQQSKKDHIELKLLAQALLIIRDTIFWKKEDLSCLIHYLPINQWYLIFQKLVTKKLSGVKHLDLSGLDIEEIPYGLHYIKELGSLDLSSNRISNLAYQWERLNTLRHVNLSSNLLTQLSGSFAEMGLHSLSIQDNPISIDELKGYIHTNHELRHITMQRSRSSLALSILEKLVNLGLFKENRNKQMLQLVHYFSFEELQFRPDEESLIALLNNESHELRQKTIEYIHSTYTFNLTDLTNVSLGIAGKISYEKNRLLEDNKHRFGTVTAQISETISHILLGELPGNITLPKGVNILSELHLTDKALTEH